MLCCSTPRIPMYASAFRASPNTTITLNNTAAVLRFGISLVKALWKLVPSQTRRRSATHISDMRALRQQRMTQVITHQMVGLVGLEPTTPALSRRCSNQLSYRPQPSNLFWSSMGHPTTDKCGYLAANSCLHFPERR